MDNDRAGNRDGQPVAMLNGEMRLAMARRLKDLRDRLRKEYGELPDSTPFIRAERNRRG